MLIDLLGLLNVALSALRSAVPGAPDVGLIVIINAVTQGDWRPLEALRLPVRQFFLESRPGLATAPEQRRELVEQLVDSAMDELAAEGNVNIFVGLHALGSVSPLDLSRIVMKEHLRGILDSFLDFDGTPQQTFSNALRESVARFSADWHAVLLPVLDEPSQAEAFLHMTFEFAKTRAVLRSPTNGVLIGMGVSAAEKIFYSLRLQYTDQNQ